MQIYWVFMLIGNQDDCGIVKDYTANINAIMDVIVL